MTPDQKFFYFIKDWANKRNCTFEISSCDGNESPNLIDGMAVDDVWGWLIPNGEEKNDDKHFGCLEWRLNNGKLEMSWNKYET